MHSPSPHDPRTTQLYELSSRNPHDLTMTGSRPCENEISLNGNPKLTRYRPCGGETICSPLMPVRSKNRGGSTSVRGRVRSPRISGGRRWLSCRQPAFLQPRQLRHGTDRRIALFQKCPLRRGHDNPTDSNRSHPAHPINLFSEL